MERIVNYASHFCVKPISECHLYTFVDFAYLQGRDPMDIAKALCDGGSDLIQVRAKESSPKLILEAVKQILPLTGSAGVHLVVNDHLDVAHETGAAFCHLGQEDFFNAGHIHVSQLSKPGMRIGLSTQDRKS